MTPHAAKLIVAYVGIAGHTQRIRDLALLLNREQDVGLHAKDEGWCVGERTQARSECRQVRRGVDWWWMHTRLCGRWCGRWCERRKP